MAQHPQYVLTPGVRIDRSYGRSLTLHAGLGATRGMFPVPEPLEDDVIQLVLQLRTPMAEPDLIALIQELFEVDERAAGAVLAFLIRNEIVLSPEMAWPLAECVRAWARYGWKDPALFHLATYGQRFDPHATAEAVANDAIIAQPEATIERIPLAGTTPLRLAESAAPTVSMEEVLARIKPVDSYLDHDITLRDAFDVVNPVFTARGRGRSALGHIVFKSFPSGGARHPLEVYLVVKAVSDASPGVYHLASATGALTMVADAALARQIDAACFLDRRVQTSHVAVVITCRWFRHMWKYRYARSYRMILIEVGHAIQSLMLSAAGRDYEMYFCLSVDEEKLARICALSDRSDESPAAVLALGRNAVAAG
jgi:SagB-type dehydrogenase family enzyme